MADRTVTRAHLSEAVYQEVGLSRNESAELVETVLRECLTNQVMFEAAPSIEMREFKVEQHTIELAIATNNGRSEPLP